MPTYRTTARNQFRSPSGAVNEAPDGPGAMATMLDDVDNILGIGGAEYCATGPAVSAIPTARCFVGKLAYQADNNTTWRYVGAGNTVVATMGGQSLTNRWQAWHRPPTVFTPTWTNVGFGSPTGNTGIHGISAGLLWVDAWMGSTAAPTPSTSGEAQLTLPISAVAHMGDGNGIWGGGGGSSAANNQHDLYGWLVGTVGTSSTIFRIRARVAQAVGASVKQNPFLGTYITGASGDNIEMHFRGVAGGTLA